MSDSIQTYLGIDHGVSLALAVVASKNTKFRPCNLRCDNQSGIKCPRLATCTCSLQVRERSNRVWCGAGCAWSVGADVGQHGDCMWLGLQMRWLHGMHAGHLDDIHIICNE